VVIKTDLTVLLLELLN